MPTTIAIGFSHLPDVKEATFQACIAAKNQLNTIQTDLVIVLASSAYAIAEILPIIHSSLQPKKLIGSSTASIMTNDGVFDQGIAVLCVNSDDISFGIAMNQPSTHPDLRTAGFDWGRKINANFKNPQHHGCILFSDYSIHSPHEFIRGAQEVLGFSFPFIGAISSDNFKYKNMFQICQKELRPKSVTGLLLGGARIHFASRHGYKPLGKPRHITRSYNNIIHTIDNQPAINIYKEFLGPQADALSQKTMLPQHVLYPLGIYIEAHRQYLLKNAVDILPDGSIVCQGDIPQEAEVHLMIGNRDTCRNSTIEVATTIKDALGGRQAKLLFLIEGASRHKILRHNSFIEIQAIKEILGYTTPLIGMSSFGEIMPIGPTGTIGNTQIQNQSIMIIAID